MLKYDGKEYRNLEEQVRKNQDDIKNFREAGSILNQFGIKIVATVPSINDLPSESQYKVLNPDWQYGDAYAVGQGAPYSLHILTRKSENGVFNPTLDFWFMIEQFPASGPQGEQGLQGEPGERGVRGSQWSVGNGSQLQYWRLSATQNDQYLDSDTGMIYTSNGDGSYETKGSIMGIQGLRGPEGPQGPVGLQGNTGDQGPKGDPGYGLKIMEADLTSAPDTTAYPPENYSQDTGLVATIDGVKHLYGIVGDPNKQSTWEWKDLGPLGVTGPAGPQGSPGVGINNLTSSDISALNTSYFTNTKEATFSGTNQFSYGENGIVNAVQTLKIKLEGTNGISIAVANQVLRISLNAGYLNLSNISNNYIPFKTSSGAWGQYPLSTAATPNTIQLMSSTGTLSVTAPTAVQHATNKEYVDSRIVTMTQSEYDNIVTKDPTVLYCITD